MHRYDVNYSETLRLHDGTEALVRLVRPSDAPLLQAGFAALTPETRYLRFFAHKQELSDREAEYLTDTSDQHFAIGAIGAPGTPASGIPMGVARYARGPGSMAEAAVVVVDGFQGLGLGTHLIRRLAAAAWERGIDELQWTALGENRALVNLVVKALGSPRSSRVADGTRTLNVTLHPRQWSQQVVRPGERRLKA